MGADGLDPGQQVGAAVHIGLQFRAGQSQGRGGDENSGVAGVDQRRADFPHSGNGQHLGRAAGGEHRAVGAVVAARVQEFQPHFGRREGHAVQFEAAQFLDLAVLHGHVGDDALAQVGLPDADHGDAVASRPHQSTMDGEGADGGAEVAAVAAPVDDGLADGDLAEPVVDVAVGAGAGTHDDHLAGAGGGAAHAVYLLLVGVGAADHAHQDTVADGGVGGKVGGQEEHTLAGAAAHVEGGNGTLSVGGGHGGSNCRFRIVFRKRAHICEVTTRRAGMPGLPAGVWRVAPPGPAGIGAN